MEKELVVLQLGQVEEGAEVLRVQDLALPFRRPVVIVLCTAFELVANALVANESVFAVYEDILVFPGFWRRCGEIVAADSAHPVSFVGDLLD